MSKKTGVADSLPLPEVLAKLQTFQNRRSTALRLRIMQENATLAVVAHNACGYHSRMKEKARKKCMKQAQTMIAAMIKKKEAAKRNARLAGLNPNDAKLWSDDQLELIVMASDEGIQALNLQVKNLGRSMEKLAAMLPVANWLKHPERRGFALLSLAQIIGECGDLQRFSTKGKIKKRMGLAPYEKNGEVKTGSTWKSGKEGKLTKEEWKNYGYCPHRRSIMYVIANNLQMQNKGEYRKLYDDTKARLEKERPDWSKGRRALYANNKVGAAVLVDLYHEWNRVLKGQKLPEAA